VPAFDTSAFDTGAFSSSAFDLLPTSASVGGTGAFGLNTARVQEGGRTITIGLSFDTWVAAGATFDAQRQNIIDGLDSDQSEATGWNAVVRDALDVSAVVRTSDTLVTITLEAAPTYDIKSSEVITVTVPASALVISSTEVTATPTFSVEPVQDKAGRIKRTRELVEVDGQFFDSSQVNAIRTAQRLAAEREAERIAEEQAEKQRAALIADLAPNVRESLRL
jgi:hypothetical protein